MDMRHWIILWWNIRGFNSESKWLALKNKIEESGCAIICLQETKKDSFDHSFIRKFSPRRFDKFEFVPSLGVSVGLAIIWNNSIFSGTLIHRERFALSVQFTSVHLNRSWTLTNIYGPSSGPERQLFVDWFRNVSIPHDSLWMFLGDFNFMRSAENRNKPGGDYNEMMTFNEIISGQSLIELPLKGRQYTWSNMQEVPLLEQLDWCFSTVEWNSVFPNTIVKPLSKPVSDHVPCVVSIETSIPRSKLFRFENFWPLHPGFKDTVKTIWNKHVRASNSATALSAKLKNLRRGLKVWSKSISKLSLLMENCNKFLLELDNMEDKRLLYVQERNFRIILKKHLNRLLDYQNKYWKKRCTYRWAQLGDENTRFFHARASERYRQNSIVSVTLEDGRIVDTHEEKAAIFLRSFKERMGVSHSPSIPFDLENLITRVPGLDDLSVPFTKQEIDKVIKMIPADKAPGPDGFNGLFLKVCWEIIAPDFYQLCDDFWEGNITLQSLNSSYITLIPKKLSPETVNDYKPISLLNCVLKVLTKILAQRLQKWILKIVHRN
jgi:exonuclease III